MFVVYIQPPPVTKGGNVSSAAAYQAVIRGRRRIVACMYHWVVCKYICKAVPNDERYSHSNSRNSKYLELCSVPKPQYMPFTPSSMAISHPHVDPALPRHPRNSIFEYRHIAVSFIVTMPWMVYVRAGEISAMLHPLIGSQIQRPVTLVGTVGKRSTSSPQPFSVSVFDFLIHHMRRPRFVMDDHMKPGILCLLSISPIHPIQSHLVPLPVHAPGS